MTSVTALKGVRTRFRNVLDREVTNAREIIGSDLAVRDRERFKQDASKCLRILTVYCKKLEEQMSKLADAIGDKDPSLVEQILDDDCALILSAEQCSVEVEQSLESIDKATVKEEETKVKVSEFESVMDVQRQMQEMMNIQMSQQREFFDAQRRKESECFSVKLPKLDLNSFGGNKLHWAAFWDAFECTVHKNTKLSNIEKMNYLSSKIFGEARRAVAGLALSNENYEVAVGILKERFGSKQEGVTMHYKALLNISPASPKVESLRAFLDNVERHLRSLEVLEEDINQHVFVSLITSKLPEVVLRQLELNKGAKSEWTVDALRDQIRAYVSACEKAERAARDYRDPKESKGAFLKDKSKYHPQQMPFKDNSFVNGASKPQGSAETLFVKSTETPTKRFGATCRYCSERHWSDECRKYKTLDERKRRIKGACYKCLKEGHFTRDCKTKRQCVYCSQYDIHHRSLCPKKFGASVSTSVHMSDESASLSKSVSGQAFGSEDPVLMSSNEIVLMQTANTSVSNSSGSVMKSVRILLDSGSQRTYITESLAKQLGLRAEEEQELKLVTFGSDKPKVVKTKATHLEIVLKNGTRMSVTANIVPTISGTVTRNPLKQRMSSEMEDLIGSVDLADTFPAEHESSTIEVLIGNDYYLDLVLSQRIEVAPGLYLLNSKLGWILTGRTSEIDNSRQDTQMLVMTYGMDMSHSSVFTSIDDVIPRKPDLEDFWNIESIGIIDKQTSSEDQLAIDNFRETLQFDKGRYYVTWPWKEDDPDLPVNRELAYGRLKSCVKKLENKPELFEKYDSIIRDQLEKGVIEKADSATGHHPLHYIPHHAVLNPKFRVVYDASAKTKPEHSSLNESLCRGPVLLHDLCGLLMHFRLHSIALVSDIEKAFLQIGLQSSQRDVTRFLWLKNCDIPCTDRRNIQEYRFCRVPFGVISSPFLLGATVESHLDKYDTEIALKLKDDIYCDNVISGADTEAEAIQFYQKAKSIFNDASMNLREWLSNSDTVNACLPTEDRADLKVMKVLGHRWDYKEDTITIRPPQSLVNGTDVTKRNILKVIASVFDPLGLVAPVVLPGKVLLQQLWSKGLDWDEQVTNGIKTQWTDVRTELGKIPEITVPRCVLSAGNGDGAVYNLLCFCDASKEAYATTVYLHHESEGRSKVDLVFAKTRLAPVKEMSIPRLELMAVLIGARCSHFVKTQLNLTIKHVFLWTDSQCVLGWINSEKTLPVFVRNRVSEIKEHELIMKHVCSKENPADVATRGATVDELRSNSLWWHGPEWLADSSVSWDKKQVNSSAEPVHSCAVSEPNHCSDADNSNGNTSEREHKAKSDQCAPFSIDSERFSSWTKLVRVTAYVMRFIKKLRRQDENKEGALNTEELVEAEQRWVKYVQRKRFGDVVCGIEKQKSTNLERQLGLFIDDEGILRCKGRMEHSGLSEGARFPVLLPKEEQLTKLIVKKVHIQNLHSGVSHTLSQVRHRYWIVHGRATVRSVLRTCTICRRHEGGPYKMPPMASFPKARVNESKPFSHTGIDYMGPMYIKTHEGPQKVWICLFTCLVTRSVHLELVLDMSTEQYLMSLRRFVSQRGTPTEIISDNAQQFKTASVTMGRVWCNIASSEDIQSYFAERGIKCTFIVELAPWMGGFYERLVGIVKRALRKSVGRKMLSVIQLQTILMEIEAVINSRPLVYVDEDINSSITLIPNHFLTLNPDIGIPEVEYDVADRDFQPRNSTCDKLLQSWKKGQKLLNSFWRLWKDEYMTGLRERMQTAHKQGRVKSSHSPSVGDVVLLKDDLPRGCWKLGRVVQLVHSRDGYIRSAKVTTASGKVIGRPLKLLYPIECSNGDSIIPCDSANMHPEKRPVRNSAVRAKHRIKAQLSSN